MNPESSSVAQQVDFAFYFIVGISTVLLVTITALMIFFVVRYHHRRNPVATDIEGSVWLEVVWTVIPVGIVLAMFWYGYVGYQTMTTVPQDAMVVKCTGMMWRWDFEYENGVHTKVLRVPNGKPVKVLLTSNDVIHSFYVPAFRIKKDVVPGKENVTWFQPLSEGEFDVLCAEYCGIDHSKMLTKVIVLPPDEFERWYEDQSAEATVTAAASPESAVETAPPPSSTAADDDAPPESKPTASAQAALLKLGEEVVGKKACLACHTRDGTPLTAPSFKGLWGSTATVVTDGQKRQVGVDKDYILRSLADPTADLVEGYRPLMPPAKLTEVEKTALLAYLKSLR